MSLFTHENIHMTGAGIVGLFLLFVGWIAHKRLMHTEKCVIPPSQLSSSNIFEVICEMLLNLMEGIMGDKAKEHFPLIAAIFVYILACNVIGLIPGVIPPTENLNTNFAVSSVVFLYYNYKGMRTHGVWHYFKHFLGPVVWLGPLMFVIEIISHLVRPLSLGIRLFGNMMGDHTVLGIFSEMAPILVPVIFLGLGLFVSLIQAFVFSLLSIVYIELATVTEEHH